MSKKKPKFPPVLFVFPVAGADDAWVVETRSDQWFFTPSEPYISLTALNKLLATKGIDPIKVVDDE